MTIRTLFIMVSVLLTSLSYAQEDYKKEDSLRRTKIAEFEKANDKEAFLKECDKLISFHQTSGDEKFLFDAYATKFDRLHLWGRLDEAQEILNQMSDEAQRRQSLIGKAITAFCFGQFYLGNYQPQEAESHYLTAFRQLQKLGETSRAIRAGFNLQAIQMNLGNPKKGLEYNDSTLLLLVSFENQNGKMIPAHRLKQTRYRFVLMQRLNRMDEAAKLKDSLLHYAEICNATTSEIVQTSLAQYEQLSGQKEAAYNRLEKLIEGFGKDTNYVKMAQYRKALADFQYDNKDFEDAVESYRQYTIENDSAQVHKAVSQLNELTKKYELNELKMKNETIKRQLVAAIICLVLLVLLFASILVHNNLRRKKNKILFEQSMEVIRSQEKNEMILVSTDDANQSAEEVLFKKLVLLIQDEKILCNPEIDRDKLSSILSTNRTYLADAIKRFSGRTISDFITEHRLRYAAEHLASDMDIAVNIVGENAGFPSRSTFYRKFYEHFGMSPSEYRFTSKRINAS